jgi:hypothetical protein
MICHLPATVNTMNLIRRISYIEMEELLAAACAQRINGWMLQGDQGVRVILVAVYQPFPPLNNGLLPSPRFSERNYLLMEIKAFAPVE